MIQLIRLLYAQQILNVLHCLYGGVKSMNYQLNTGKKVIKIISTKNMFIKRVIVCYIQETVCETLWDMID